MKVRHKRPPHTEAFDVRAEFEYDGLKWYVLSSPNDGPWTALQSDYEPVPAERWEDVTAHVGSVGGYMTDRHGRIGYLNEDYRLRKVQRGHPGVDQESFLKVERKVSE